MALLFFLWGLVTTPTLRANSLSYLNSLTSSEIKEIEWRLQRFYTPGDTEGMKIVAPKHSISTGEVRHPHSGLMGKKTDPTFRSRYCNTVLKKHFPGIVCGGGSESWEGVKPHDRVEDLSETWMSAVTYDLDEIPTEGRSDLPNWSDDYWRTKWGYTSYRYSQYESSHEDKKYLQMIALYQQPSEFLSLLKMPLAEAEKRIIAYSPSEKYDLTVGDEAFTLTQQQKQEGKASMGSDGDVEDWMGLCHGWAPAALMVDRPLRPVTVRGEKGVRVTWYPADLKAMLTLQWSNGDYANNFIGGRCGEKLPKLYPNGRLKNPECFDNNPATFHLALGNMIGREKASFVMDKTFDYEVWNQPIVSYEFTYFNPLQLSERSKKWQEVAVEYNERFKKSDRFQKPLTRGKNIKWVVGVIATVVYVSEVSPPAHTPEPEKDELLRMTLTYDLEIGERVGKAFVTGGEWHENAHPDFLWVPQRGSFASMRFDRRALNYKGEASESITQVARKASGEAYPLCQVLKYLIQGSVGKDSVRCLTQE